MGNLINILIVGGVIVVAMVLIGVVFSTLYRRASKEHAFVRTGLGGQKVVMNGGAIILPVLHETIDVNMNTMKLEVKRSNEIALITKDRMRVDVQAEFYVRVQPLDESIAIAAQTLGKKTMNPIELKELVEGKFVDALRSVAAGMDLEQLHEQRSEFVKNVQQAVSEDLTKNGLELETVSLTGLDQTRREFLDENNLFDAEGMTRTTEITEERRKKRNDIEQTTRVEIAERNLQAKKREYEIQLDEETSRLENEQKIESQRAERDFATEKSRTESRRQIQEAEIEAEQVVAIRRQDSQIAIARKSQETSQADAEANTAKAEAVKSEEQVVTARETERANREKAIKIIKASEEAESDSVSIVVASKADREAAENRAEAIRTTAEAEAEAEKTRAAGQEETYRVRAAGERQLHEAANILNSEQVALRVREKLIEQLPQIIAESVKPMSNIDSIRVVDFAGANGFVNGHTANGVSEGGSGNLAEQVVNGAMRYRAFGPMIDGLLKEVGMDGGSLADLAAGLANGELRIASAEEITQPVDAPQAETQGKPAAGKAKGGKDTAVQPAERPAS